MVTYMLLEKYNSSKFILSCKYSLFKALCPLKGHTYLKKTSSFQLQVCLSTYDL